MATDERQAMSDQLEDKDGKLWYTVVYPSYAERSFVAEDDDEASAIAEELAQGVNQTLALYRCLRMRKLELVHQVLPDRGF